MAGTAEVKEEVVDTTNQCFMMHPNQLLSQRETPAGPQQRMCSQGLPETALRASLSPSSIQNNEQDNHKMGTQLHHMQYLLSYNSDRSPLPLTTNSQDTSYSMAPLPTISVTQAEDRHPLSSSAGVPCADENMEFPKACSPNHTSGNSHIPHLNSAEGGGISNSNMNRSHSSVNKPLTNDPLSHRIIEKRRRDRMNNCLADLSKLIPTYYLKKGRGRIEKTEIIEMAIKYMKHLQAHACNKIETCEITTTQEKAGKKMEHFQMGYQEAMSETLEFLRESEGLFSGDSLCVRILNHLNKHCEMIMKNEGYNTKSNDNISSSSSSGYHANGSSSDGNGSSSTFGSDCKDALITGSSRKIGLTSSSTEESAYRTDDQTSSDDRSVSYLHSGEDTPDPSMQGEPGGAYLMCPGPGSNGSSSGDDNSSRLYKFKSNMKHRFSADAEHSQPKKKRREQESFSGYTDSKNECKIRSFNTNARQFPYTNGYEDRVTPKTFTDVNSATPLEEVKTEVEGPTVPIFALSSNGSFYVPLSIKQSIVAPLIASQGDGGPCPILHPVSIYVKFSTPQNTVVTHPNPPVLPPVNDVTESKLSPYNIYGDKIQKEERRRYPNYHNTGNIMPLSTPRSDVRNIRTISNAPAPDMQSMTDSGMSQFSPEQRNLSLRHHAMKEYSDRFPGRGMHQQQQQLQWPYHIAPT